MTKRISPQQGRCYIKKSFENILSNKTGGARRNMSVAGEVALRVVHFKRFNDQKHLVLYYF